MPLKTRVLILVYNAIGVFQNIGAVMRCFKPVIIMGLVSLPVSVAVSQQHSINAVTGAQTWSLATEGVLFSLTQILPEQARAFYVNRGFTLDQINAYASSCVYMTVLRNDSAPGVVHFVTNDWTVSVDQQEHQLKNIGEWIAQLEAGGAQKSPLIAFRWAQFPAEQEYEPGGDWNQGMLSIGLPAESQFDITARWDIEGKPFEAKLKGVRCAN